MTDIDEEFDRKLNEQQDMISNETHEELLKRNILYAMEQSGIPEIMHMINHTVDRMQRLGHQVDAKDILNRLRDGL